MDDLAVIRQQFLKTRARARRDITPKPSLEVLCSDRYPRWRSYSGHQEL